jgi:hypothetical protein
VGTPPDIAFTELASISRLRDVRFRHRRRLKHEFMIGS